MTRGNSRSRASIRERKRAARALPPQQALNESGLQGTIVTSPSWVGGELSLHEDLRMAKSALLYMDTVEMYSYATTLSEGLVNAAAAGQKRLFEFIDQLPPYARSELGISAGFRDRTKQPPPTDIARLQTLLTGDQGFVGSASADDLNWLASEGLLIVKGDDGFNLGDSEDEDRVPYRYLLEALLDEPSTHPLFDRHMADAVRRLTQHTAAPVDARVVLHAREGALGTALISRLPTFPEADVASILHARTELSEPLTVYRSAVLRMANTIQADSWDWTRFESDVDDLVRDEVEPAKTILLEAVQELSLPSRVARGAKTATAGLGAAGIGGSLAATVGNLVPQLAHYLAGATPGAVAGLAAGGVLAAIQADAAPRISPLETPQGGFCYLLQLEQRL